MKSTVKDFVKQEFLQHKNQHKLLYNIITFPAFQRSNKGKVVRHVPSVQFIHTLLYFSHFDVTKFEKSYKDKMCEQKSANFSLKSSLTSA